jgi:hypothetical protein
VIRVWRPVDTHVFVTAPHDGESRERSDESDERQDSDCVLDHQRLPRWLVVAVRVGLALWLMSVTLGAGMTPTI